MGFIFHTFACFYGDLYMRNYGTEVNGSKNLHGTNGTSKGFTLSTTKRNLKKEKRSTNLF